jgi:hypothetical protein
LSIIYDALKKVEENFNRNASGNKEGQIKKTGLKNKTKHVLIYILVILSGMFLGKMAIGFFTQPEISPASSFAPAVESQNTVTLPLNTPLRPVEEEKPAPFPDPLLTLNGVYFQKNEGYALINNRILKVGNTIQGATVKEIILDKVTLEFEGRIITLRQF